MELVLCKAKFHCKIIPATLIQLIGYNYLHHIEQFILLHTINSRIYAAIYTRQLKGITYIRIMKRQAGEIFFEPAKSNLSSFPLKFEQENPTSN